MRHNVLKLINQVIGQDEIQIVLDVGANLGQFAYKIKKEFPKVYVVSVEANKHCEPRLKNKSMADEVHIVALGDKVETKTFYYDKNKPKGKGHSFYKQVGINSFDEMTVTVETGDNYFKDKSFDLIKIDVQGAELDVIKGANALIKKSKYLILELALKEYNINGAKAHSVIQELNKLGFYLKEILEEHTSNSGDLFQIDALFSKDINTNKEIT